MPAYSQEFVFSRARLKKMSATSLSKIKYFVFDSVFTQQRTMCREFMQNGACKPHFFLRRLNQLKTPYLQHLKSDKLQLRK